jgi:hypothetical protein
MVGIWLFYASIQVFGWNICVLKMKLMLLISRLHVRSQSQWCDEFGNCQGGLNI